MENEIYDKETDAEVIARRSKLFDQYVKPYLNMIYKLCRDYSACRENVEENYTEVLVNFYRRIETYNPERSILTWLHICTKRQVFELERQRARQENRDNDVCQLIREDNLAGEAESEISYRAMDVSNYRELYNDDILAALDEMKPIHRDIILYQAAGYSLKEIAEIEYRKGTLSSKNIETVKSRSFIARQYLKKRLTKNGESIANTAFNEGME